MWAKLLTTYHPHSSVGWACFIHSTVFIEQFPLVRPWAGHWGYDRVSRMRTARGGGGVSVLSREVRKSLSAEVKVEQRQGRGERSYGVSRGRVAQAEGVAETKGIIRST